MFTIRQKIVKQGPASGHSARQVAFADKCFRTSSTSTSTLLIRALRNQKSENFLY